MNEQEKAQLRLEKLRLETKKEALHLKLESDAALASEQTHHAVLVEEKANRLQVENSKLQESLLKKEHTNLTQRKRIERLESNVRNTYVTCYDRKYCLSSRQARADQNARMWHQQRVVNEEVEEENEVLRLIVIAELETSAGSR